MIRRMPSSAHQPALLERRTLEEALNDRIQGLETWLREHAPECVEEQRHLDEGTRERAYWHYGYLVALRDARGFLLRRRSALH